MSVGATFVWETPPSVVAANLKGLPAKILEAMLKLGEFFAAKVEAYARRNARWTDRTGNARQGLTAKAMSTAAGVMIVLFHTMDYGIWLEIAFQGRYAIILETLEKHYGEMMAAFRRLVGGR